MFLRRRNQPVVVFCSDRCQKRYLRDESDRHIARQIEALMTDKEDKQDVDEI